MAKSNEKKTKTKCRHFQFFDLPRPIVLKCTNKCSTSAGAEQRLKTSPAASTAACVLLPPYMSVDRKQGQKRERLCHHFRVRGLALQLLVVYLGQSQVISVTEFTIAHFKAFFPKLFDDRPF